MVIVPAVAGLVVYAGLTLSSGGSTADLAATPEALGRALCLASQGDDPDRLDDLLFTTTLKPSWCSSDPRPFKQEQWQALRDEVLTDLAGCRQALALSACQVASVERTGQKRWSNDCLIAVTANKLQVAFTDTPIRLALDLVLEGPVEEGGQGLVLRRSLRCEAETPEP